MPLLQIVPIPSNLPKVDRIYDYYPAPPLPEPEFDIEVWIGIIFYIFVFVVVVWFIMDMLSTPGGVDVLAYSPGYHHHYFWGGGPARGGIAGIGGHPVVAGRPHIHAGSGGGFHGGGLHSHGGSVFHSHGSHSHSGGSHSHSHGGSHSHSHGRRKRDLTSIENKNTWIHEPETMHLLAKILSLRPEDFNL